MEALHGALRAMWSISVGGTTSHSHGESAQNLPLKGPGQGFDRGGGHVADNTCGLLVTTGQQAFFHIRVAVET